MKQLIQKNDFEWYVTANTSLGDVVFPATASAEPSERMYQTVVVAPLFLISNKKESDTN
jgi:hypothetical protein